MLHTGTGFLLNLGDVLLHLGHLAAERLGFHLQVLKYIWYFVRNNIFINSIYLGILHNARHSGQHLLAGVLQCRVQLLDVELELRNDRRDKRLCVIRGLYNNKIITK